MLIVSQSSTTNVGMRSYLNHIFSKYIHLETCLAADVDTERMEKADLVLFSSRSAARMAEPLMTPKIRYLICIRTFNHTYLNRILSIPSNSEVYLVNDSERSAKDSIQLLYTLGITQYRFIPYYPDCPETDPRIQYAVTVGENKLAPRNVQTLVDIGIRDRRYFDDLGDRLIFPSAFKPGGCGVLKLYQPVCAAFENIQSPAEPGH